MSDSERGGDEGSKPSHVLSAGTRWRRRLMLAGVVLVGLVLPLMIRVAWDGHAELNAASRARDAGDQALEIEHLGRALRWRAPLLSHDEVALDRLWALAEAERLRGAEGRALALSAYREVRRSLLATRSWGIPRRDRWERANTAIAELMVEQERALGIEGAGDPEVFHLDRLSREPGPEPTRGNLAALAFLGWLGGVVGFLLRGIDERGRLRPRAALRWGLAAIVLLLAWMVLLARSHGG